ncbi:MAG: L-carnitine dehydratase/bile acid-inducible protein F [uncultured Acetobacteraceae bacterium]|uniref:L-carnitine dehydratase/bile acid-inducible protein F n=1 Tax=uncultured Acetobacteraceae bacterium TaxID=169975 RepID=A0A6J4HFU0_9PROT|nr:MAG: L-carnitine dehydratase/bile acid-inducible protein F [uncultured Acetobacteraceae bacterium]
MPDHSAADATSATQTKLPLAGLRVLDLTLARAGPTCVRHLADWGADIVRVEPPSSTDGLGGPRDGFDSVNLHRNKRSIALDLKHPDGHAAFLKLAATADVLVENMRMQVKHRLKIAYDDLKGINPRLVYASISGFGQTGPYSKRGGVDQIAQGMGGLMSITGEPGRGPMRVGIPIDDLTAGNLLALGVMMKLYDRERTGQGGYVHTSLLEAQVFMLDFQASRFLMDGEVAGQAGNDHPVNIPMGVFPTADKPINIAASSPKLWEVFCKAAGREDWLEVPEWKTTAGRSKDRARVNAAVSEVTKTQPSEWWIARLEEAGIPCGPINDIKGVFDDPQVQHLEMAMPIRHRRRGDTRIVASPLNVEGLDTGVYRDVPDLGEHGAELLAEAGLSAEQIEDLKAKGALGGA